MGKKAFMPVLALMVVVCLAPSAWSQEGTASSSEVSQSSIYGDSGTVESTSATRHPIMHPDPATLYQWHQEYLNAPLAEMDSNVEWRLSESAVRSEGTSVSILGNITYTPSERNQSSCGNCWVWAGTGVVEAALKAQNNVSSRLSVQFPDSCISSEYACCGGDAATFASWYNSRGYFIPWSNTNASFQDGSRQCSNGFSAVACSSIATSPQFGIDGSISVSTIQTVGVSQDQAIANIKNLLNQGKAVYYGFYLGDSAGWTNFYNFWDNNTESTIYDPDTYCGHTWINGQGGGHAVVIVGYNDDSADASQRYWVALNSWGTANGNRPNGLFRLKMNMNYGCTLYDPYSRTRMYSHQFQTLNVTLKNLSNGDDSAAETKKLLWHSTNGGAVIWSLDSSGNYQSSKPYGPFAGWTALGYDKKRDGSASLLWVHDSGAASIWSLDSSDNYQSCVTYGPYAGWTASGYAVNSDGTASLLWVNDSGAAAIWSLDGSNNYKGCVTYGPYAGWTASEYVANSDGTASLLWVNDSGAAAIWSLGGSGNYQSSRLYGPFAGWGAVDYDKNRDGTANLLWTYNNGTAAIWSFDSSGSTVNYVLYGPCPGWTAIDYNKNQDGTANLLWKDPNGTAAIWSLDSSGNYKGYTIYGPYIGWEVVLQQ